MAKLEKFLDILSHLRTDKNRKKRSALTCRQAPHKPFLFLSVLDLVAEGAIQKNFAAPSMDLVETFNGYWSGVMPSGTNGTPYSAVRTRKQRGPMISAVERGDDYERHRYGH